MKGNWQAEEGDSMSMKKINIDNRGKGKTVKVRDIPKCNGGGKQ